jgi:hypothetical protein
LPLWWDHISPADKLLLLLIVLLFFWNLFTIVKQIEGRDYKSRAILMISLAGSCSWFITAPDPRFGTGFLIPLLFSLYTGFYPLSGFAKIINPKSFGYAITCIAVLILSYSAYRGIYFFQPKQLVLPLGVEQPDYQKAAYQGVSIYVKPSGIGCGFSPVPCTGNPSPGFILRGQEISDGFKNVSGKR